MIDHHPVLGPGGQVGDQVARRVLLQKRYRTLLNQLLLTAAEHPRQTDVDPSVLVVHPLIGPSHLHMLHCHHVFCVGSVLVLVLERPGYLAAVRVLHPLAETGSEAGGGHHRHQAAVVVLRGLGPGDGGGAGVQQSDADGLRTLPELLQQLASRTWNQTGRVHETVSG